MQQNYKEGMEIENKIINITMWICGNVDKSA